MSLKKDVFLYIIISTFLKKLLSILFICSLGLSCLKPEEFPVEPIIVYENFIVNADSAELVISFTDGDGDIGLRESDTSGEFSSSSIYHHNLFVEYWEKVDGVGFQRGKDLEGNDISFLYRVPFLTPSGKNKALKGKIRVTIEPTYYNPISPDSDTILLKIKLLDRDFNESNVVETGEITR